MEENKDTPLSNLVGVLAKILGKESREFKSVIKIGIHIKQTGMSVSDCALLALVTDEELSLWRNKAPQIDIYFRLKRIQYKSQLLQVLNEHATTNKDTKISTYLLEKNFSDEFDSSIVKEKVKQGKGNEKNTLDEALDFVRRNSPNSPVVEANTLGKEEVNRKTAAKLELAHLVKHG